MRRALMILITGVVVAGAAYWAFYLAGKASQREFRSADAPELQWLKREFNLSDGDFARIVQLHEGYLPHCAEMCRRIDEQDRKLRALLESATAMNPEIEGVMAERARLKLECQTSMLRHFFEVSHTMPAAQGRRYLTWVQASTFLGDSSMADAHRNSNSHPHHASGSQ